MYEKWLVTLILLISGRAFAAGSQASIQSETLLKTQMSWDGTRLPAYPFGQPEMTLLKISIPAHTRLDWHTHPVINTAYIMSGNITVIKKEDGKRMHLKAGKTLPELVNSVHCGETGDEPAVWLVFYAGKPGLPLSIAEKKYQKIP